MNGTYLGDYDYNIPKDMKDFQSLSNWVSVLNDDLRDSGSNDRYYIRTEELGTKIPFQAFLCKE